MSPRPCHDSECRRRQPSALSDASAHWTTVGVSHNVVEASWEALVDSIDYKLYKDKKKRRAQRPSVAATSGVA
jgi:2-isopropylmalate synthase